MTLCLVVNRDNFTFTLSLKLFTIILQVSKDVVDSLIFVFNDTMT